MINVACCICPTVCKDLTLKTAYYMTHLCQQFRIAEWMIKWQMQFVFVFLPVGFFFNCKWIKSWRFNVIYFTCFTTLFLSQYLWYLRYFCDILRNFVKKNIAQKMWLRFISVSWTKCHNCSLVFQKLVSVSHGWSEYQMDRVSNMTRREQTARKPKLLLWLLFATRALYILWLPIRFDILYSLAWKCTVREKILV